MNPATPNPTKNGIVIISIALHLSLGIYFFVLYQLSLTETDWTREWRILPEALMNVRILAGLRMALAEAMGVYGLVAAFVNRSLLLAVPFLIAALVVQFFIGGLFGILWANRQEKPF